MGILLGISTVILLWFFTHRNINATWCANIQVYIVWYLLEEYWLGTQGIVVSFT